MTLKNSICLRADHVLIRDAMQIISVLIGLVCAVFLFFGIIFGSFPKRKIGLIINVAVAVVAILRLFLGGGVI